MKRGALLLFAPSLIAACTSVDSTEHCVETRYGDVVTEQMGSGLNATFFTEATCFPLTEQNFPNEVDEETGQIVSEQISSSTADKLRVTSDLAMTWRYVPEKVIEVFREKRSPKAAEVEVQNAIREGYRIALASWTIDQLLSPQRETLGDSVRAVIQRRLGDRYEVSNVFVRNIALPQEIEQAQLAAIQAQRDQVTAMATFRKDSVAAFGRQYQATVDADIKRIQGQTYAANPQILQLEIERERADALRKVCSASTTCILGVEVIGNMGGR